MRSGLCWQTRVPFHLAIRSVTSIRCVSTTRDSAQRHREVYVAYIHCRTQTHTHTHTHTHQGHVSFKRADASIKKKERNREDAITSEHSWISVNVTHTQTRQVMLSCRVMKMAACSWNLITYLAANWEKKNCGVTACFETWKGVEKVMLMSILWWNIRNLQSCTVYATDPYIHPLYTILTSPRGHVLISNDAGSGIKTKW